MAKKWTALERQKKFTELHYLYVEKNKTIGEISRTLGIAESTVFQQMQKLGIPSAPHRKPTSIAKKRNDVVLPKRHTRLLAEFFGIMLGDGKLSYYQVVVNLGTKEQAYAEYVVDLIASLFGAKPKIAFRKTGSKDVYLGSVDLTEWLRRRGLVYNKVASQVDAPRWIFTRREYTKCFVRGFFDTDGSIYKLRFGIQLSFTNKSAPLLHSIRKALIMLGYHPSIVSGYCFYLTRKEEVKEFFKEIKPANPKHERRFHLFVKEKWAGTQAVNEG